MKKILLAIAAFAFCITSAQAENSQSSNGTAAYTNQSVANLLVQLKSANDNLQDISLGILITTDGNKRDALAATLLVASNTEESRPGDKTLDSSPGGDEEDRKGDVAADSSPGGDKSDKTGEIHSESFSIGSGHSASPS